MGILLNIFKRFRRPTSSGGYSKAVLFLLVLLLGGSVLMKLLEGGVNEQFATFEDSLWWSFVTIATVGYGDKYPVTSAGRLVAVVVMFGGIGSFGFIAGSLLEDLFKRRQGRMRIKYKGHYVICSYNFKAECIVREIKTELADCRIVLVAEREENPLADIEGLDFVRGDSTKESILKMANLPEAKTVIVLADEGMDDQMADAHSVLTSLAVKHLNPGCKVVAESLNPENNYHLEHAGVDEIICIGDFTAKLISRSSIHVGMNKLISELMTNDAGNELYSVQAPSRLAGRSFEEVFAEMKLLGAMLIGVQSGGQLITNPPPQQVVGREDYLIYIAANPVLYEGN